MSRFVHQGLTYSSDDEFLACTVPFLRFGVHAGDHLCAVLLPSSYEIPCGGLQGVAGQVEYIDACDWYVNPARTLNAYRNYLRPSANAGSGSWPKSRGMVAPRGRPPNGGSTNRGSGPHIVIAN